MSIGLDHLEWHLERLVREDAPLIEWLSITATGSSGRLSAADVVRLIDLAFAPEQQEGWHSRIPLTQRLRRIADLGHEYLERSEVENAITVLATLSHELAARYEILSGSEDEISDLVYRCIDGLEATLSSSVGTLRSDALAAIDVWDLGSD